LYIAATAIAAGLGIKLTEDGPSEFGAQSASLDELLASILEVHR